MAGLAIKKNEVVEITKSDPNLTKFMVGLGWDASQVGSQVDLDVSALVLKNGKVTQNKDVAFFNNKESADGSVKHHGDNRTGAGDGDDEKIDIDLTKVSGDRVDIILTLYEAGKRGQDLNKIANAFIRLVDIGGSLGEVGRCTLTGADFKGSSVLFASFTKDANGNWEFKVPVETLQGEITQVLQSYGYTV